MAISKLSYDYSTLLVGVAEYIFALIILLLFALFAFWKVKKWMRNKPNNHKRKTAYDWVFGNNEKKPNKIIKKSEEQN